MLDGQSGLLFVKTALGERPDTSLRRPKEAKGRGVCRIAAECLPDGMKTRISGNLLSPSWHAMCLFKPHLRDLELRVGDG